MGRAESPLRDRMIFNVGARRSGTFWLQRIVTSHPEVSAVPSETALFSDGIAPLFERFQHAAGPSPQLGALYVERERLLDATRDLCDAAFASLLEPGARYLAERTAPHVLYVDLIAEIYPDARFIQIIRDGRDVARSLSAQVFGPESVADAAEEWRISVTAARRAELPPEQYREVRYEALLEDPRSLAAELFEWLELPVTEELLDRALTEARVKRNVGRHGGGIATGKWRHAMSAPDLATFYEVAGDLLADLGYTRPSPEERAPAAAADAEEEPRASGPGRLGRLRDRITRARSSEVLREIGAGREMNERLRLADKAVGALRSSRVRELAELMAPDALVRRASANGTEAARGAEGIALLEAVVEERWIGEREAFAQVYPGAPTIGYVVATQRDGVRTDCSVFVTIGADRIQELAIYRFPLVGEPSS